MPIPAANLRNVAAAPTEKPVRIATRFNETFAASDENLRRALDLEAKRINGGVFTERRLREDISVERNEGEMDSNNPEDALSKARSSATAFQWHNYGKSTIGASSDLRNITIAQVREISLSAVLPAR